MRTVEEVKVTPETEGVHSGGEVHTHPAFAQISANRVSGGAVLYGSDLQHQHYIRLRISPSELKRSLSNDWPHAGRRSYIEVDLSEAQWATFVSSMNVGGGVQCTLRSRDGQIVPEMPEPTQRHDQFARELKAKQAGALSHLEELAKALQDSGLPVKKMKPLLDLVTRAQMKISDSTPFVAEQFTEHMERVTQAAKAEVNAYAVHLLAGAQSNVRIGGESGASDATPMLQPVLPASAE